MEYKSSENRLFEILQLEKGFLDKSSFIKNSHKSNLELILENGKISNFANIKHSKNLKPFSCLISYLELKDIFSLKCTSRRINKEIDNPVFKEYFKNVLIKSENISDSGLREIIWC
jgi:hypothetical protein